MAITIYTTDAVVVIDSDVYEIEFDDEFECDEEVESEDEDGVEYDVDGVAWWFDEENDVLYFFDDESDDWIEYDGEE